jgi:hypothetical protein
MAINRFTRNVQAALVAAQERAQQDGNPEIDGLPLLAALLADPQGVVPAILRLVYADPNDLRRLSVHGPALERRLQQALPAAALRPSVYAPRIGLSTCAFDLVRPEAPPTGRGEGGGGRATGDGWLESLRVRRGPCDRRVGGEARG